jgi:YVTN family beta-propeller protein
VRGRTTSGCLAAALLLSLLGTAAATPSVAATAELPFANVTRVVADAHGHVLVAGGHGSSGVWVGGADGTPSTLRTDLAGAAAIVPSADGSHLYVSLFDSASIVTLDSSTLAVTATVDVPGTCPDDLAVLDGSFWFGSDCDGQWGSLLAVPMSGGTATTALEMVYSPLVFAPRVPDGGLVIAQRGLGTVTIARYSVSGTALTKVAESEGFDGINQVVMDPDGVHLDVAHANPPNHARLRLTDLGSDADLPSGTHPVAVAATSSLGGVVAAGVSKVDGQGEADITVYRDGVHAGIVQYPTDHLVWEGLALSPDGHRLYAVTTPNYPPGGLTLRVVDHPARLNPVATAAVSRTSVPRLGTVGVTGRLTAGGRPVAGRNVVVSRVDVGGTHRIGIRTTSATGSWSIVDKPSYAGTSRYVVSFAGDSGLDLAAATGRASVLVLGLATSMTFTATPSPVYGANATLTVHLGRTYTGRTVSLWERHYGNPIEQRIGVYRVNASGDVVVARKATDQTTFIAAFGGDQLYMPKRLFRTVGVRARISETLSGWWATVNGYRLYHAVVDPVIVAGLVPHPGCLVFQSQVLTGGRWVAGPSSPCFAVDGSGRVGASLSGAHTVGATWRMRAVFRGSGGIVTTAGPWILLQFTK